MKIWRRRGLFPAPILKRVVFFSPLVVYCIGIGVGMTENDEKIWFLYLAKKHEGPFTKGEVAAKISQGLLTASTLVWKDGMAEWQPLSTVLELHVFLESKEATNPAAIKGQEEASKTSFLDDPFILQGDDEGAVDPQSIELGTSIHSLTNWDINQDLKNKEDFKILGSPEEGQQGEEESFTKVLPMGAVQNIVKGTMEVDSSQPLWIVRGTGNKVSGMLSMESIHKMLKGGELAAGFQLWRSGWLDFQDATCIPELKLILEGKQPGLVDPFPKAPTVLAEDLTLDFGKEVTKENTDVFHEDMENVGVEKRKYGKKLFMGTSMLVVLVGLVFYWQFYSSTLPKLDDVNASAYEKMKVVAGQPSSQGIAFVAAKSKTSVYNPIFYVASNAPPGTALQVHLEALPGKIIGKTFYTVKKGGLVADTRLAKVGPLSDRGKPIPMGHYSITVMSKKFPTAKFKENIFVGPKNREIYKNKMKEYELTLGKRYQDEVGELKEMIRTSLEQEQLIRDQLGTFLKVEGATIWRALASTSKPLIPVILMSPWKQFMIQTNTVLNQIETLLKQKLSGADFQKQAFYPVHHQKLLRFLALLKIQTQRVVSAEPAQESAVAELLAHRFGLEHFQNATPSTKPIDILVMNGTKGPESSWAVPR